MAAPESGIGRPRNTALKDAQLTYRACTMAYARSMQLSSPTQLVGQTDFDFLSERSAALVHAADQRVLTSGRAEVIAGAVLSKRTTGLFFVHNPVFNRAGHVCGVEVFVISIAELHQSYRLLLGNELQLRDVIDQSPFGVLIHRNFELLYVNSSWLEQMGSAGSSPGAEEIRKFAALGSDNQLKTIRSVKADGAEVDLQLQAHPISWNGNEGQAIYCVAAPLVTVAAENSTKEAESFIEKRHGHRRNAPLDRASSQIKIDEVFFKYVKQPMIVCDAWLPVQANSAAKHLLDKDANNNYLSLESWFSDRERASVEALLSKPDNEHLVNARVQRGGQSFAAYISTVVWEDRSLLLISLQPGAPERAELEHTIARLRDYVSSAGDFFWEMDKQQRMTHLSMEMKDVLGVETRRLLNVPLGMLVSRHVHADDEAEWKVLMVDLNKHLPFRDREYKWLHMDGQKRVVRLSGVPVFDIDENFVGYRGVGWDYTSQHHSASIVAYHASHDSLTGLVNRREFEARCNEAIANAAGANQALCFIDLDNFKRVNDTAGHLAGDELLRQLSALFTSLVRKSDVLARLGGDEFGLLIYGVGLKEAMRLATQLRAEVESFQFQWEGQSFSVGASIGLVLIDARWETRSALFSAADAACYDAKSRGRNRVSVYSDGETARESRRDEQHWDEFIKTAIAERRVKLALQRIEAPNSKDSLNSKIEILMRLPSPDGDLLLPSAVLPLAERLGLSVKLDKAVIEASLDWLEGQPHVTDRLTLCCINIGAAAIRDETFLDFLMQALEKTSIDTSILCFELSESTVSASLTAVGVFLEKLAVHGCQFAMDDFSGGLNSFNYLKKLPFNFVKINSTSVGAIMEDPVHYAMVKSINDVAQTLGKQTIAESVESQAVLDKLNELGVNLVQGYHIAAPEIIDF